MSSATCSIPLTGPLCVYTNLRINGITDLESYYVF